MSEVSLVRLYLLRAMYLLLAVGLGLTIWPGIVAPPAGVSHMAGVVRSVLGAVGLLALLGLRYPLKMLPLLFFELLWKIIWVLAFALPLLLQGQLDPARRASLYECLLGIVVVPLVLPWGYVFRTYFRAAGARWNDNRPDAG